MRGRKAHPNLEKAINLLLEKGYSERKIARTYLVSRTLVRRIKYDIPANNYE
jgi:DNA invertase Pin-like site-specific DNA recombinase